MKQSRVTDSLQNYGYDSMSIACFAKIRDYSNKSVAQFLEGFSDLLVVYSGRFIDVISS